MFRLFVLFVVVLSAINCYAINLEEAIDKAIKNSSKIKSQFYQYKSSEKYLKSNGLAGFLPDISLQYTFDEKFNVVTNKNNNQPAKGLHLSQRIIGGGGTFATFSKSSHPLKAEKMRFHQVKQEVALETVKAYVTVLQRIELLKLREHRERVSLEHLSAMKKRFSLGEVTNTEVSLATAKFSSSVSERVDAEGKLKLAKIAYFDLVGEDPEGLSEADEKLPSTPELHECLELARTKNLSLKAVIYQKKAANMEVLAEYSKWLPSLNLGVNANFEGNDMVIRLDKVPKISIGFTLDVPIFKRGMNVFSLGKAKMDVKKSTYDYYEAVKNIEQMVVNTWNNILTAKAVIKASQEAEKAAALALEGVEQEVSLNLKSTSDLLDIEDALFKARSDLADAKSSYVLSAYKLLFMINNINL
ncbi:MAG: Outer membrane efflux protein BepC [Wolbachia endosymbiont of Ctenocephalides orientis wCori]|nr:MAG: Outer membrane efflux protein BepC [Wolbachia endosymbiont of Ctenocephalides orientis wCori]